MAGQHSLPVSTEQRTKEEILELFPGKEDVFDLVLRPRFLRILNNEEN